MVAFGASSCSLLCTAGICIWALKTHFKIRQLQSARVAPEEQKPVTGVPSTVVTACVTGIPVVDESFAQAAKEKHVDLV